MTTDYTDMMPQFEIPSNPFPGLRPFEFNESLLYFGRDGQSEQLLRKLAAARFMAVIGTSGSGKSSLVRAGLLPALFGGFMSSAGSDWRIALFRPSNDPIGNLAGAINDSGLFGEQAESLQATMIEATLRRGSLGLVEAVRQSKIAPHENVLVVVDQFEELFRFAQVAESEQYQNDAAAFVKLLLEASHQKEIPIYVVMTMRSDFLGDCSLFWDLPEAINEGQYLIPRLTREQRREAITGPIAVCGADITPRLVNRLLNDMGDNPDQLPILQHALMRTWSNWKESHREAEPIDLPHYKAIGGMSAALSVHADEAYNELPDERSRKIAEKIFKGLTEKGADNREIRRPIELEELCALTEASEAEVIQVIEGFRHEGRSFLMPPAGTRLDSDSLIDISHESLIRNWERLKGWVEDEARSARIYRRLAETAVLYNKGEAGLWRDPDLQLALDWRDEGKPNKTWARRYHTEFEMAMSFLDASHEARDREARDREAQRRKEIKRTRRTAMIFALAFLLSLAALVFANNQRVRANESSEQLAAALQEANKQKDEAQRQTIIAGKESAKAEAKAKDLEIKQKALTAAEKDAKEKAILASENAKKAEASALKARDEAKRATDEEMRAEAAVEKSRVLLYAENIDAAQEAYDAGDTKRARELLEDETADQAKLRGFEWYYLKRIFNREAGRLDNRDGDVRAIAFSRDNKFMAASGDQFVKLWDASTRRELKSIPTGSAPVNVLDFSPDGKLLAAGGDDGVVKLWKAGSTEEPITLQGDGLPITTVAFSRDGKTLVTGSRSGNGLSGSVKMWDTASRTKRFEIPGITLGAKLLALSPDGKTIAVVSKDPSDDFKVDVLFLFGTDSGKLERLRFDDLGMDIQFGISSVAFSPDSKTVIAGFKSGEEFKVISVESKKQYATLEGFTSAQASYVSRFNSSIVFSPDGKALAIGSYKTLKLYDAAPLLKFEEPRLIATLLGQEHLITDLAFSSDGKTLAAGDSTFVRFWDADTRREFTTPGNHKDPDIEAAIADDSKRLNVRDMASQLEMSVLGETFEDVKYAALSPNGKFLAAIITGRLRTIVEKVRVWDSTSRKLIATFDSSGFLDLIRSVAVSSDGKSLAAIHEIKPDADSRVYERVLKLWNADSPREPVVIRDANINTRKKTVVCMAFSPDGKTLVTGNKDGLVKLWSTSSHRLLDTYNNEEEVKSVVFTPDNRTLITVGSSGSVKLWPTTPVNAEGK